MLLALTSATVYQTIPTFLPMKMRLRISSSIIAVPNSNMEHQIVEVLVGAGTAVVAVGSGARVLLESGAVVVLVGVGAVVVLVGVGAVVVLVGVGVAGELVGVGAVVEPSETGALVFVRTGIEVTVSTTGASVLPAVAGVRDPPSGEGLAVAGATLVSEGALLVTPAGETVAFPAAGATPLG